VPTAIKKSIPYGRNTLTLETGEIARQAGGAVLASLGDSVVLVESIDTTPLADLVVERAMYWDSGGVTWAAGTNLLATPIP